MPFLRRRQENEPDVPVTGVAPAAPEPAAVAAPAPAPAPAPDAPLPSQPLQAPENPSEAPVESQFRPVEGADEMLDMPLGTLIFRAGLIAPQQLEDALAEGLRSGKRLGEVLLSRGWLREEDLSRLLAGQKGLPYADLEKIAIDRELAQAMSYDDARNEMALPIVVEFGLPVVAMADPDEAAMERLRAQLGPEVRFVVGAPSVLTRLIEEVLGGVPAQGLVVAPGAVEQSASNEPPAAPAPPEPVTEAEAAEPDSSDQEAPAPAPDLAAQEIQPIIVEGEIDYPSFSEYQPIPEAEIITRSDEQLPAEVQTGEYGYYDDPSLLEGNAWQAGEAGPPAAEPAGEINDLTSDQYNAEQPPTEAEAPVEEPPAEEVAQPFAEAEAPVEEPQPAEEIDAAVEQPQPAEEIDAAVEEPQPAEEVAQPVSAAEAPVEEPQPLEDVEAPLEQDWEEQAQEVEVEQPMFAPAPEQPEEAAGEPSSEEGLTVTTPAWMRGEVNVITADVADFIDSGAPNTPEYSTPPPVENDDVAEVEPEPVASEDAAVEVEPILEQTTEAEAIEPPVQPDDLAPIEPAATELGAGAPSWASEPVDAAEPNAAEENVGDVSPEPPATPEGESSPESGRGVFELVLRLADGDRIPIGSFDTVEGAQGKAAEVVKQFAEIKDGSWPLIGGRFLRPETIVSIDVEQHGSGWGGSNSRGRMFSGNEGE